jgi:hypothetical protein
LLLFHKLRHISSYDNFLTFYILIVQDYYFINYNYNAFSKVRYSWYSWKYFRSDARRVTASEKYLVVISIFF